MSPNRPGRPLRHALRATAALAAVTLLWLGLRPRPVEVDLAPVVRGPFELSVEEDGETRIREPYLISAPLAGRLLRVELRPGDLVRKGQTLAIIDPDVPGLLDARSEAEAEARIRVFEATQRHAESQLEAARAETEKARRYLERDRIRHERGEIAAPMLADAEHALRVSQSQLAAAESSVEVAKYGLDQARAALLHSRRLRGDEAEPDRQFEVCSPIDGVVLRRFQESSTVIPASGPILEIGDPDDLEIRIDVLSEDAVRIRPGNPVRLERWGGDATLDAVVRRVEPSAFTKVSALGVDEQRVWIYSDFAESAAPAAAAKDPDLPGGTQVLGDGYRVEARIVVFRDEGALKAPSGALFRAPVSSGWAVYRVVGGRAEFTPVEPREDNGVETRIEAGLEEGDLLVVHPGERVRDGAAVRPRRP
jgi:HlyD family secretion protein